MKPLPLVALFPPLLAGLGLVAAAPAEIPSARSAPVRDAHAEVELIAVGAPAVRPGGEFRAGVRFRMEPGWHIYGEDPGEAGMPTRVEWQLPEGVTAGPLEWPEPEKFADPGDIITYGYQGEVLLGAPLRVASTVSAGEPLVIRATVRWLSCREICVPGQAELVLTLPTREGDAL